MRPETRTAVRNLLWLMEHRPGDFGIDWPTDTLWYGDGGAHLDVLCEEGFTPATSTPVERPVDWRWLHGGDESHVRSAA
jgi:hypothetical protein